MKSKLTHGGSAIIETEYEVREIDEYGDCINVNHYDNLREARKATANLKCWVIEKHVRKSPARLFKHPNIYDTITYGGNKRWLNAGCWI